MYLNGNINVFSFYQPTTQQVINVFEREKGTLIIWGWNGQDKNWGHRWSLAVNTNSPQLFNLAFFSPLSCLHSHLESPNCWKYFKSAWIKRKWKLQMENCIEVLIQDFCQWIHLQRANESSTSYWTLLEVGLHTKIPHPIPLYTVQ